MLSNVCVFYFFYGGICDNCTDFLEASLFVPRLLSAALLLALWLSPRAVTHVDVHVISRHYDTRIAPVESMLNDFPNQPTRASPVECPMKGQFNYYINLQQVGAGMVSWNRYADNYVTLIYI